MCSQLDKSGIRPPVTAVSLNVGVGARLIKHVHVRETQDTLLLYTSVSSSWLDKREKVTKKHK